MEDKPISEPSSQSVSKTFLEEIPSLRTDDLNSISRIIEATKFQQLSVKESEQNKKRIENLIKHHEKGLSVVEAEICKENEQVEKLSAEQIQLEQDMETLQHVRERSQEELKSLREKLRFLVGEEGTAEVLKQNLSHLKVQLAEGETEREYMKIEERNLNIDLNVAKEALAESMKNEEQLKQEFWEVMTERDELQQQISHLSCLLVEYPMKR